MSTGADRWLEAVGLHRARACPNTKSVPAAQPTTDDGERTALVSLYTAYLEDLGRIGGRHEEVRTFYLSLISALFVFLSLASEDAPLSAVPGQVQLIVGLVGALACVAWFCQMDSFAAIYHAKSEVLQAIELRLPAQPFQAERNALNGRRRIPLTAVDKFTAVTCLSLFVGLLFFKLTAASAPT